MLPCPPRLLFLSWLALFWRRTAGLAAPAVPVRPFVELSTIKSSTSSNNVDLLPSSLVTPWPTWILTVNSLLSDEKDSSIPAASWYRIPDTSSDQGFLNPVSLEELWLPLDLRPPTMQLALGLHVRNGACRHVFPAVDLILERRTDEQKNQPLAHPHRNRGLCSVPRAYQWQETSTFLLDQQKYRMVLETRSGSEVVIEEDEDDWIPVLEWNGKILERLMTRALECLAEEPPSELGHGSHVVHVVCHNNLDNTQTDSSDAPHCPKADHDLRVVLRNDWMMETHELRVRVASTVAGSTSEYLPDCYRPLFEDLSLRRPAYQEAQRRRRQQLENGSHRSASSNSSNHPSSA